MSPYEGPKSILRIHMTLDNEDTVSINADIGLPIRPELRGAGRSELTSDKLFGINVSLGLSAGAAPFLLG